MVLANDARARHVSPSADWQLSIPPSDTRVPTPEEAAVFLRERYPPHLDREALSMILLDDHGAVIRFQVVVLGEAHRAMGHLHQVFRPAVAHGATALILCHNHPWEDDPVPSPRDLKTTREFIAAGRILNVHLLDHIILGRRSYHSVRLVEQLFGPPVRAYPRYRR